MFNHLLDVYRGRRVPSLASPVIIGRNIMYHCYLWLDTEGNKVREFTWTLLNRCSILMLFLTMLTMQMGLPDSLASLSDFVWWLSITCGSSAAFFRAFFVVFYRAEITGFIKCVAELDRKVISPKAQSDFSIRKWRGLYFVFECFLVYSSLFFIALTAFAFSFLPSLLALEFTMPSPGFVYWGIHESPPGLAVGLIIYFWGCVWGGSMVACFDFLLGNIINQFILNLEIVNHELLLLGREAEDMEKVACDKEQKLIALLQDYEFLRASVHNFNQTFQPILLLIVNTAMLLQTLISVDLAIVIKVDASLAVQPAMYFFFLALSFFYWCWLGQRLSDVSAKIPFAIYGIGRGVQDLRFRKLQIMAMQITSQPLRLKAIPLFVLNYELFKSVLRRSYSIMAVLKDM